MKLSSPSRWEVNNHELLRDIPTGGHARYYLIMDCKSRLDYQPLHGNGAHAPPTKFFLEKNIDQTQEMGRNHA